MAKLPLYGVQVVAEGAKKASTELETFNKAAQKQNTVKKIYLITPFIFQLFLCI